MRRATVFFGIAWLFTVGQGAAYAAISEVVTLDTRLGAKQSFLLSEPEVTPKDVVILFSGDEGEVEFRKTAEGYESHGSGGLTAHQAMRNTLRRNGVAVAVVAPPSDRIQLAPWFRKSAEHAQDIQKVIAYLRERYPGKVYLHGHCLGSLSAASVASRLKSEGISGLILSSARSSGMDGAVTEFERGTVSVPVLLVSHKEDSCPYTQYNSVERVRAFYQSSAPKVDLITVTGGIGKIKKKQTTCRDGFHGFAGVQKDTAQAIASWMLNREFPALVAGATK